MEEADTVDADQDGSICLPSYPECQKIIGTVLVVWSHTDFQFDQLVNLAPHTSF